MRNCFLTPLIRFTAWVMIAFAAFTAFAAPTSPCGRLVEIQQPGVSAPLKAVGIGDEFYHRVATLDGYTLIQEKPSLIWYYALKGTHDQLVPSVYKFGIDDAAAKVALTSGILESPAVINARKSVIKAGMEQSDWYRAGKERDILRLKAAGAPASQLLPAIEKFNTTYRKAGYQIDSARFFSAVTDTSARKAFSAVGDINYAAPPKFPLKKVTGVVLLVKFKDQAAPTVDPAEMERMFNGKDHPTLSFNNEGSVYEYFYDQSFGNFEFNNLVTEFLELPKTQAEYNAMDDVGGKFAFVSDAVTAFNKRYPSSADFDLSSLTLRDNGNLYAFSIFYNGTANGNDVLWPHSWVYQAGDLRLQSRYRVFNYQMTDIGAAPTIGTFCHEGSHMVLNVLDYYDYGDPSRNQFGDATSSMGVGMYCLMGSGNYLGQGDILGDPTNPYTYTCPGAMSGYLKFKLGWMSEQKLAKGEMRLLSLDANSQSIYSYHNNANTTEYYMFQNRSRGLAVGSGRWDRYLPSEGVCIWHVDEAIGLQNNNELQSATAAQHYELSVMQADGKMHLEMDRRLAASNAGDPKDLYSKATQETFLASTVPNSNWWDGTASGMSLTQISQKSTVMSAVWGTIDPTKLKVISPNGGETYFAGQTIVVSWAGAVAVNVDLLVDNEYYMTLKSNVPANTTTYNWAVPANFPNSDRYKIRVTSTNGVLTDDSDDFFTIDREYTASPNIVIPPDSTYYGFLTIRDNAEIDFFAMRVNIEVADASKLNIAMAPNYAWGGTDTPVVFQGSQVSSIANRTNMTNTVWTDRVANTINKSSGPFTGRFFPLAWPSSDIYRGNTPKGVWGIVIRNNGTTSATLKSWGISITPIKPKVSFESWTGVVTQGDTIMVKLKSSKPSTDGFPIIVNYRLSGTAVYGTDYSIPDSIVNLRGRVVFQSGQTVAALPVGALRQAGFTRPKTVTIQATSAMNAILVSPTAFNLSILAFGGKPVVYMQVDTPMFLYPEEGDGLINVRVKLTGTTGEKVTVPLLNGGTAVAGQAFTADPREISFDGQETEKTVQLNILKDPAYYPEDRKLKLFLGPPIVGSQAAQLDNNPATPSELDFVIRETDPEPVLSFSGLGKSVPKINNRVLIPYELSGPCGDPVLLRFATSGTAQEGADYTLASGYSLVIAPRTTTGSIGVNVIDNHKVGSAVDLIFKMTQAEGVMIGGGTYDLTILAADYQHLPIAAFTSKISKGKMGKTVSIEAVLSRESTEKVILPLAVGGSAVAGIDFKVFNPQIVIPPRRLKGNVKITLLKNQDYQDAQALLLSIVNPVNAAYAADGAAHTLLITNTNPLPKLYLEVIRQQVARNAFADVVLKLDPKQQKDIAVPFSVTTDLTLGKDYHLSGDNGGNIIIPRNKTRGAIRITLTESRQTASLLDSFLITFQNPIHFPISGDTVHSLTFENIYKGEGYAQMVLASNLSLYGKPGLIFTAKPKMYGLFWNSDRQKYQKASMTVLENLYPAVSTKGSLKSSPLLYDRSAFNALYRSGGSVLGWTAQDSSLNIMIAAKAKLDSGIVVNAPVGTMLTLSAPFISTVKNAADVSVITTAAARPGTVITLEGREFGVKPSVWFEYQRNGKTQKLNCPIESLPFRGLDGKPSATFPDNGIGRVLVTVPLFPDSLGTDAVLVLNSGIGFGAVKVKIAR